MLNEPVLIDTGPLIAIYSSGDRHHEQCKHLLSLLPVGKAYTCWPVLTEAFYMLRHRPRHRNDLLGSVLNGEMPLLRLRESDLARVQTIFDTYRDQEIDLADACLLHLAEREGINALFTLDRRHFSLLKKADGQLLKLLPEVL